MPQRGFTLIELLIVLAIIGVLSTSVILIINPNKKLQQARDIDRIQAMSQISRALDGYYTKNKSYPNPCTRTQDGSCDSFSGSANWIPGIIEDQFLQNLPKDPVNSGFNSVWGNNLAYFYISETTNGGTAGQYYILGAWLEDSSNPKILGNLPERPQNPDCNSEIGFHENLYLIRSYRCPNDPPEAN